MHKDLFYHTLYEGNLDKIFDTFIHNIMYFMHQLVENIILHRVKVYVYGIIH